MRISQLFTIFLISLVLFQMLDCIQISKSCPYAQELIEPGGNTLFVGGTGPGNYSTIQDAINNATDGDTIFVFSGNYTVPEDIGIYSRIWLIGENTASVNVENKNTKKTIYIFANQVMIRNFTFQNICISNFRNNVSVIDNDFLIEKFNHEGDESVIKSNGGSYNVFKGNTISLGNRPERYINPYVGIGLISEYHFTISHNFVYNTYTGIYIISSSKSGCISKNTMTKNEAGLEISSSFTNYDTHQIYKNNFLNSSIVHATVDYGVHTSFGEFIWTLFTHNVPSQNFTNNYWDDHHSSQPRQIYARYHIDPFEMIGIHVIGMDVLIPKLEVDPHPVSSPFLTNIKGG